MIDKETKKQLQQIAQAIENCRIKNGKSPISCDGGCPKEQECRKSYMYRKIKHAIEEMHWVLERTGEINEPNHPR